MPGWLMVACDICNIEDGQTNYDLDHSATTAGYLSCLLKQKMTEHSWIAMEEDGTFSRVKLKKL